VNPIEIAFFAVAVLLPTVGGGALLYFLSRGNQKKATKKED
jgi:hypothetical protein